MIMEKEKSKMAEISTTMKKTQKKHENDWKKCLKIYYVLFLTKNKLAIFQKKRNIDILITTLLYYYKDTRLSHYHRLIGGGGGQRVTDSVKSSWAGKGVEIQMLTLKNWEIIHHSKMKTIFFLHIYYCALSILIAWNGKEWVAFLFIC